MKNLKKLIYIIIFLTTSCISSNYQVAETVDKGEVEFGVFIDSHSWIGVLLATGLSDNVEVGLQATISSVPEAYLKYSFFKNGNDSNRLAMAIKPFLGFGYLNDDDDKYYYKAGASIITSKKIRKDTAIFLITTYKINYLDSEDLRIHGFYGTLGISEDILFLWFRPELTISFQNKFLISPGMAVGFKF